MAAFCVYSCGLFSAYLCKYPDSTPPHHPFHVSAAQDFPLLTT